MQTYTIPSRAVEGSRWVMGDKLEKTSCISPEKKKYIPGPGAYEPDYKAEKSKMPSYSMKGRHDDLKRLVVPGPGS